MIFVVGIPVFSCSVIVFWSNGFDCFFVCIWVSTRSLKSSFQMKSQYSRISKCVTLSLHSTDNSTMKLKMVICYKHVKKKSHMYYYMKKIYKMRESYVCRKKMRES